MSAESGFREAHAPSRVVVGSSPTTFFGKEKYLGEAPKSDPDWCRTPAGYAPPQLNNRDGPASDESLQRETVKN
jgi:hypothetical protein